VCSRIGDGRARIALTPPYHGQSQAGSGAERAGEAVAVGQGLLTGHQRLRQPGQEALFELPHHSLHFAFGLGSVGAPALGTMSSAEHRSTHTAERIAFPSACRRPDSEG